MKDEIILQVKNLNKEFKISGGKSFKAVDDISFDLKTSHTLGVVGESGSGKSTLARCIMGLYPDASGEIIYKGKNILKENQRELKKYRKDVQMIFQDPYSSLNPRKKCKDIIASGIRNLLGENRKKSFGDHGNLWSVRISHGEVSPRIFWRAKAEDFHCQGTCR